MTGSSSQLWLCARSAKFTIIAYYPLRQSGENQPQGTGEGRFSGFWLILGNSDSVPTKNLEPQGTRGRTEGPRVFNQTFFREGKHGSIRFLYEPRSLHCRTPELRIVISCAGTRARLGGFLWPRAACVGGRGLARDVPAAIEPRRNLQHSMGAGVWLCHAEHFEPRGAPFRAAKERPELRRDSGHSGGGGVGRAAGLGTALSVRHSADSAHAALTPR